MGLAGAINQFSQSMAVHNGHSYYSELLPGGAVLCGVISIFKGVFKILFGK
jgi:hypothetical protein